MKWEKSKSRKVKKNAFCNSKKRILFTDLLYGCSFGKRISFTALLYACSFGFAFQR